MSLLFLIIFYIKRLNLNSNHFDIIEEIIGEIFDELYTTTGILATTDNLESYNMELDSKMDDDETICVHHLILTYRRRIKMTHR